MPKQPVHGDFKGPQSRFDFQSIILSYFLHYGAGLLVILLQEYTSNSKPIACSLRRNKPLNSKL